MKKQNRREEKGGWEGKEVRAKKRKGNELEERGEWERKRK